MIDGLEKFFSGGEIATLHHDLFNQADEKASEIIACLSTLSDEDLSETRRRAEDLGQVAWRIVCACDKEKVNRAAKRGDKGAIIAEAARESQVTPKTIYLNARISDVIDKYEQNNGDVTLTTTINIDKTLVECSLEAPDPVKALGILIANKENMASAGLNYSTRDARRDVATMKIPRSETLLPDGKFSVILADPPWRYDFGNSDSRIIENHYPTMELEDICALDIPSICADDSVLFLWTTSPKLEQSFVVLKAWGFHYSTCMVWDKEHIGMGYYFRQQHEILLVAKRGALPVPEPSTRPSSVLRAARGKHSEKPDELYTLLEAMYPRASKVELFCRSPRDGWTAWGNEVCP